jgi:hypothetical protein
VSEPFAEGQEVIWTGLERNFARRVRIVAARRGLRRIGQQPEDAPMFYDIADPTIKGTVYSIPGDQLEAAADTVDFPSLPPLGDLVADDPFWRYPSGCAASEGVARLRVWMAAGGAGHLAVVTELGLGASVTNSVPDIWRVLRSRWPGPLTLLEHWPAAESFSDDGEHLDQVVTDNGRAPSWRRVWPVPATNPDHSRLTDWMSRYGYRIIESPAAKEK